MLPNLKNWLNYFERNAQASTGIDWMAQQSLSHAERACISDSIATFQIGEYSEGHGLMKFARHYANIHQEPDLIHITRMFVKEEQNHAGFLKRFMANQDIRLKSYAWSDQVFRIIRRYVGYELSITILIVAELIALTYYRALHEATSNRTLKSICEKILTDEVRHIEFESSMIRSIQLAHHPFRRCLVRGAHQVLYTGTVLVVWVDHQSVLRRGGFTFLQYWCHAMGNFRQYFPAQHSPDRSGLSSDR